VPRDRLLDHGVVLDGGQVANTDRIEIGSRCNEDDKVVAPSAATVASECLAYGRRGVDDRSTL
jgi:hypothetical protein